MPGNTWLVDGYNVLRVSLSTGAKTNWWTQERRSALTALASRLPETDDPIVLVFDGRQLTEPTCQAVEHEGRQLVHVFAPSADEWIVNALSQVARPMVVTADRPLADRARHRSAQVMATDAFVELCGGPT